MKKRLGLEFEQAVYNFSRTLDSNAEVIFNHHTPDRDTGELRQCDVWINANFGGHWPLSILVSCKDHRRKLNSGHIGTFINEVRSTGASTGVIYSRSGFTEPAIRKAKANGLSCCRFYQNEPADLPEILYFQYFACVPQIRLSPISDFFDDSIQTWNDLFSVNLKNCSILEKLCSTFIETEERAVKESKNLKFFPNDYKFGLPLYSDESGEKFEITGFIHWKKYRALTEATLLNGSYCVSNNIFHGTQMGPRIYLKGQPLDQSWIEIDSFDIVLPEKHVIAVVYHGKVKEALLQYYGSKSPYEEIN
jgi:hypothetical protein